jgi:hypothetical protein
MTSHFLGAKNFLPEIMAVMLIDPPTTLANIVTADLSAISVAN